MSIPDLKLGVQGQTVPEQCLCYTDYLEGRVNLPLKKWEPGGTHHISHTEECRCDHSAP